MSGTVTVGLGCWLCAVSHSTELLTSYFFHFSRDTFTNKNMSLTLIYAAVGLYDTQSLNGFFSNSSYVQK